MAAFYPLRSIIHSVAPNAPDGIAATAPAQAVAPGGCAVAAAVAPVDPEAEFIRSNIARRKVFEKFAVLKTVPESDDTPRDTALRILAALGNT